MSKWPKKLLISDQETIFGHQNKSLHELSINNGFDFDFWHIRQAGFRLLGGWLSWFVVEHFIVVFFFLFSLACPPSTYKNFTGYAKQCSPCPAFSGNSISGSKTIEECACFTGYKGNPDKGYDCTSNHNLLLNNSEDVHVYLWAWKGREYSYVRNNLRTSVDPRTYKGCYTRARVFVRYCKTDLLRHLSFSLTHLFLKSLVGARCFE